MVSDNFKGALLMSASMAAFTINDTFMKALSDDLPLMQAIFLRGVLVTLVLALALVATRTRLHLARRDWIIVGLRSIGEAAAAFLFIAALFNAPLANMTAILQALPLTVTLAGALLLGEPVGWQRLTAILIGFLGVLLIVRPGMEGFNVYSVYALGAVLAVTLRDLAARQLSRGAPSLLVAFIGGLFVTGCAGIGTVAGDWAPLDRDAVFTLAGTASFLIAGYILSVTVMRVGEIGFVAPFRYTGLIWALVLGFLVFGDWPQPPTLIGAAIVMATGAFTLWRERRAAQRAILSQVRPARMG